MQGRARVTGRTRQRGDYSVQARHCDRWVHRTATLYGPGSTTLTGINPATRGGYTPLTSSGCTLATCNGSTLTTCSSFTLATCIGVEGHGVNDGIYWCRRASGLWISLVIPTGGPCCEGSNQVSKVEWSHPMVWIPESEHETAEYPCCVEGCDFPWRWGTCDAAVCSVHVVWRGRMKRCPSHGRWTEPMLRRKAKGGPPS